MTMKTASIVRSPCELLRKINDLSQEDSDHDKNIRSLCFEAEKATKKLAQELNKYKKEAWKDWWEENREFNEDMKRRLDDKYKVG